MESWCTGCEIQHDGASPEQAGQDQRGDGSGRSPTYRLRRRGQWGYPLTHLSPQPQQQTQAARCQRRPDPCHPMQHLLHTARVHKGKAEPVVKQMHHHRGPDGASRPDRQFHGEHAQHQRRAKARQRLPITIGQHGAPLGSDEQEQACTCACSPAPRRPPQPGKGKASKENLFVQGLGQRLQQVAQCRARTAQRTNHHPGPDDDRPCCQSQPQRRWVEPQAQAHPSPGPEQRTFLPASLDPAQAQQEKGQHQGQAQRRCDQTACRGR